ncbi:MAG: glycosyltransferase family 4 protein [Methylovirgula sp.]
MDFESRLAAYIASQIGSVPEQNKFLRRSKEFYWTLARLTRFERWRDNLFPRHPKPWAPPSFANANNAAERPRVLVDVTATYRSGERTGIQRVVREIANHAFEKGDALPVLIKNGHLFALYKHPLVEAPIEVSPGDKFLMLDATWGLVDEYIPIMQRVREAKGQNVVGLHDIIPFLYPAFVTPEGLVAFQDWFERVALTADAIVCVSRWSAASFIDYVTKHSCPRKTDLPVGWWRLGADFESRSRKLPSLRAFMTAAGNSPLFLSVGTLDLRKGHSVVLDAFERLWEQGIDARFVIIGKAGWQSSKLERRLKHHREWGRRLSWFEHAGDSDVLYFYKRARALIFSSIAEGFGLPLVEASFYGLPVIVSDMPNFRELCGESADYFEPLNDEDLARVIKVTIERPKIKSINPIYTWRQSTELLLDMVTKGTYQTHA